MIRRLRLKFVCINMLIVLTLLAVMLGLVLSSTHSRLEADSMQVMRRVAAGPMRPPRPNEESGEVQLPFFRLSVDENGALTAWEGGYYDLSDESQLQELIDLVRSKGSETGVIEKYHLRFLVHETPKDTAFVFADMSGETAAMKHLLRSCILIGLAGIALFLLVSILLARWAVRPVARAWEQQRQFVGDASHELKTPLTVILTGTELLQSGNCTPDEQSRFLTSIRIMAEQMRGLVDELLSLTRADHTGTAVSRQIFDLSKCVSDAILPFEPVYYEQALSIEQSIEENIRVRGDEAQLRQVVEIFLDNAQKYCTPLTCTRVSLLRQGRSALLTVENSGEELSKEDLKNVFRRFYRLDRARSMNHSYGLGLAIAKQIVESHRGKIWAESRDGINRFCVQLHCE